MFLEDVFSFLSSKNYEKAHKTSKFLEVERGTHYLFEFLAFHSEKLPRNSSKYALT
jgi:hypothetical protein